ncbi:VWA domain-containing protein [candidate division KSB1 bacterium]
MSFADPYYLFLFLFFPGIVYWYISKKSKNKGTVRFSNLVILGRLNRTGKQKLKHVVFILRMLVLTLVVLGLARPQSSFKGQNVHTEGVDIVLAMDVSTSMRAVDFEPKDRLGAAKVVAADFIKGRTNDRIGMVIFAGRSYTQCPLTLDYGILLSFLDQIETGMVEDGTAIGMAIATAVNRLRESKAKSKVLILLTDGRNNKGELDPLTASNLAEAMEIKIYTIGMGKRGTAMYPFNDPIFGSRLVPVQVDIDEDILTQIANNTSGKYFRATDEQKLEEIFKEISEMEKTKIEIEEYTRYTELFVWFIIPAFLFFILEIVLTNTIFRKIP